MQMTVPWFPPCSLIFFLGKSGRARNMSKECRAIKAGMLLNYADEPRELSPKMIKNDELRKIENFCLQNTDNGFRQL